MIFNSFIIQVFMIILSGGMLLTYIRPTFMEIGGLQNAITEYKVELEKVNATNQKFASLTQKTDSISAADYKALLTYMPDEVDDVAVARDIFLISQATNVYLEGVDYSESGHTQLKPSETENLSPDSPFPHAFSVKVSGTYAQVKDFFSKLEQNNYPLEIKDLKMTSSDTGLITADLTIVTYSHK